MSNVCYIAAAGAGKTQLIIDDSIARYKKNENPKIICIVTYTQHNQNITTQRIKASYSGVIPQRIIVIGWYKFLLDYIIKPFKGDVIKELYHKHIGFTFTSHDRNIINTTDNRYFRKKCSKAQKYLIDERIDSQNISEFACECINKNPEAIAQRFDNIFDVIYFDEAQDFRGYDFDVITSIIKSPTDCIIVADPRQHTYSSNNKPKYKKYTGKPDLFFKEKLNTKRKTFIEINYDKLNKSHRCHPAICEFASKLQESYPATIPDINIHKSFDKDIPQGVFLILENQINNYRTETNPLELYWEQCEKHQQSKEQKIMNMGESKGDEANAVLIHPTKDMEKWLSQKIELRDITRSKFYVAITRAKYCVAIIVSKKLSLNRFNLPYWKEEGDPIQLELPFNFL